MRYAIEARAFMAMAAAMGIACGGGAATQTGDEVRSSKARIATPSVTSAALQTLVAGEAELAVALHRALGARSENVFFSPLSIQQALSMTYAGAAGATATQMATALRFGLPAAELHPAMNAVDLALASRAQSGGQGADGKGFRLHVVNAIWGQREMPWRAPFLDTLALHYGAGLRVLDFVHDPEGCRHAINAWVEGETETRIKDLLPSGSITELTRLVLTNAIYFNAAWAEPFPTENTRDGVFHLEGGGTMNASTMSMTSNLGYAAAAATSGASGWQAVELPYEGRQLSMTVIVPTDLGAFERSLSGDGLRAIFASLRPADVQLTMPRFKAELGTSLRTDLQALGMTDAFDGSRADFSSMDGQRDLYIGDVIHKAFVSVDEKGTEAAAATAVIVVGRGVPTDLKTMKVDRPFLFVLRDLPTGAVLFMGRIQRPTF